ncbi:hypothetical protein SprV_0401418500 [Sparganum proliferum]
MTNCSPTTPSWLTVREIPLDDSQTSKVYVTCARIARQCTTQAKVSYNYHKARRFPSTAPPFEGRDQETKECLLISS